MPVQSPKPTSSSIRDSERHFKLLFVLIAEGLVELQAKYWRARIRSESAGQTEQEGKARTTGRQDKVVDQVTSCRDIEEDTHQVWSDLAAIPARKLLQHPIKTNINNIESRLKKIRPGAKVRAERDLPTANNNTHAPMLIEDQRSLEKDATSQEKLD